MHSNQEVTIARGNGRFTIDNICIIRALSLMFKNFTTGNVFCQCAELQNLVRFLAHSTEFMSRPVTALHSSSPQAYAGRNFDFAQGGSTGSIYCSTDKYQNKHINRYKDKLIDKYKNKRMMRIESKKLECINK